MNEAADRSPGAGAMLDIGPADIREEFELPGVSKVLATETDIRAFLHDEFEIPELAVWIESERPGCVTITIIVDELKGSANSLEIESALRERMAVGIHWELKVQWDGDGSKPEPELLVNRFEEIRKSAREDV